MKLISAQFTVQPTDTNIRLTSLSLAKYKLTHRQTRLYIHKNPIIYTNCWRLSVDEGIFWHLKNKSPCICSLQLFPWLWLQGRGAIVMCTKKKQK